MLLVVVACGKRTAPPAGGGTLRGTIAFPPSDTIALDLPAAMHRCSIGRSIVLDAIGYEGSGVMLRIRFQGDAPPDSLPIIFPTDTAAKVGASVAVRYYVHDTPHSTALDSGAVHLQRRAETVGARIAGSGLENAIRTPARLEFRNVPWATDTVPCNYAP